MTAQPPMPKTASPHQVIGAALDAVTAGQRTVLATVVRRRGSAPATPGQKLALLGAERALGTIGGGALELRVLQSMLQTLQGAYQPPRLQRFELGVQMGMCCGGGVEVMVEVMDPALQVLLVGAGHIGTALAPLLDGLGFEVVVCDAREALADRLSAAHGAITVVCADHDDPEVSEALRDDLSRAAMVVMTHDHQLDQEVVEWALRKRFGFVGGVGSRAKAARSGARLAAKGFDEADIARVRMPCGVDIQARLPPEIAVAIAGELIGWRATSLGLSKKRTSSQALVDA